jgi:hypothetical protein
LQARWPGFLILTLWWGSCGIVLVTAVAVSPEAIQSPVRLCEGRFPAILLNPGLSTKDGEAEGPYHSRIFRPQSFVRNRSPLDKTA